MAKIVNLDLNKEVGLDVIEKASALRDILLEGDSIYIKTKETLDNLFHKGDIKSTDKPGVYTEVLSNLNNTIVTSTLSVALEWAIKEKELLITEAKTQSDINLTEENVKKMKEDVLIAKEEVKKVAQDIEESKVRQKLTKAQTIEIYSRSYATYGTPTTISSIDYTPSGTFPGNNSETKARVTLVNSQASTEASEKNLRDANVRLVWANTHKSVTEAVANNGTVNYTNMSENGFSTPLTLTASNSGLPSHTLSHQQYEIGIEQAKGFKWNAWSNAGTSAASTIGVLIGAGEKEWLATPTGTAIVNNWKTSINNLANIA